MRVLISPASKHGGTAQIGRRIASIVRDNGIDADVTQPEDVRDVSPYAGFILGSALYYGSWLRAAQQMVDRFGEGIRARPAWLFSSGPLGSARPKQPVDSDLVADLIFATGAVEHRLFGGRLEAERLSRPERFIARWVGATDGDYREWDAIDAWAVSIAHRLLGHPAPPPTLVDRT